MDGGFIRIRQAGRMGEQQMQGICDHHAVRGGRKKQSMSLGPLGAIIPHPYSRLHVPMFQKPVDRILQIAVKNSVIKAL